MTERVTELDLGNLKITFHDGCPENWQSAQKLNWDISDRYYFDALLSEPIWLLDAATTADYGFIQGGQYTLFSNTADPGQPEEYTQHLVIDVNQSCDCDFDVLKGILETICSIAMAGYNVGVKHGADSKEFELTEQIKEQV